MGTTGLYRRPGISDREFFASEYRGEIVACASVKSVFYAAVRNEAGEVWALVVKMTRTPRATDGCNFYYKDMSEEMGPYYFDAPAAVLDALTPTTNEYALAWRAACRERLAAKAARPAVKHGDVVRFTKPLEFTNGMSLDTFVWVERSTFRTPTSSQRYRIPNWKQRGYAVVPTA